MRNGLEIAQRFCGPPSSGNGGYVAGALAGHLPRASGSLTVRLHRPPPLGVPFELRATDMGEMELRNDGELFASAFPGVLDLSAPDPPCFATAVEVSRACSGFHRHPFPTCFVCGPERRHGDGLRIFPGPWRDGVVAAPWRPDASLDSGDGSVRPEHVWAALDCPGYFAVASHGRPMLLGQITALLGRPLLVGESAVVLGWSIASTGRKHRAGTAVFGADGAPCGIAESTWIEPRAAVASSALDATRNEVAQQLA